MRIDVISDTHGYLSEALLDALQGADLIVHAGDICSTLDYSQLMSIAPLRLCLGNNDRPGQYGPSVGRIDNFIVDGLRWQVCHYQQRLVLPACDIAICGHTHRPFIEDTTQGALLMNPGSPTYPRSIVGPSMGRIYTEGKKIVSSEIILLEN